MIEIDVIIINFNSGRYLNKCLDSVFSTDFCSKYKLNVTIIDNGSTDDSLDMEFQGQSTIKIIKNSNNVGFAAACNQGANLGHADYLLFLNPDTQLFSDSLEKPLSFMEKFEHRDAAIVGIQLVDQEQNVLKTCARFPKLSTFIFKMLGLNKIFIQCNHFMLDWDHRDTREVDQVMGAFFLVRREIFEQIGGFDERFFVYFEELDLSLRISKAGRKTVYYAEAQAIHEGCVSSRNVKDKRLFYYLRSQIIYGYKNLGLIRGTILLIGTLLIEPISRVVLAIFQCSFQDVKNTCRAYIMLYRDLPHIFRITKSL